VIGTLKTAVILLLQPDNGLAFLAFVIAAIAVIVTRS
jgi:hypothetical protein